LFGLAILGAVTAEEMLMFLPKPLAHAAAGTIILLALSILITTGPTRPW
jgi:hypothetical protein